MSLFVTYVDKSIACVKLIQDRFRITAATNQSGPRVKRSKVSEMFMEPTPPVKLTLEQEFEHYLDKVTDETDAITFWLNESASMPILREVALLIFGIPTGTAAIERVFSISGLMLPPNRRRLSSENLKMMVFLSCNSRILSDYSNIPGTD